MTTESTEEILRGNYELALINFTDETNDVNSTNHTQYSTLETWSYNFWPLVIIIMPIVTVGGNLLVIVSSELILRCFFTHFGLIAQYNMLLRLCLILFVRSVWLGNETFKIQQTF